MTKNLVPATGTLHGKVAEILPNQLYFASFATPPGPDPGIRYINIDDKVHYDPFYTDFGPLNLSVLHRFTQVLHTLIESRTKRKIVAYTGPSPQNRVNGAFLMAGYLMIYHNMKADLAYLKVEVAQPPKFMGFRDAAMGPSTYDLHLHDVLRGLEQGLAHKWYDAQTFDADEYEFYERVENGDFNWIIPGKILSFCGPHDRSVVENGYPYHAPEVYFDYFREHNVTTIVRLNMRLYDAKRFTDAAFDHVDLFFIDGSTPSDEIVRKFIKVVDSARGGVAVHCKAGLGRTGTLIACWMMKEFGISAPECMAWLRIARPGSVIGPQQQFLLEKQQMCWEMGRACHSLSKRKHTPNGGATPTTPKKVVVSRLTSRVDDIRLQTDKAGRPIDLSLRNGTPREKTVNEEEQLDAEGRSQGDRLLACKVRNAATHTAASSSAPSPHAHFTSPTTPIKPIYHLPRVSPSVRTSGSSTVGGVHSRAGAARNILTSPLVTGSLGRATVSSASPRAAPSSMTSPVPIARVTVAEMKPSSKSTSSLKKLAAGIRQSPYPSGIKMDMPASSYTLRPRRSYSPNSLEVARTVPPNAAALGAVSVRRTPKSKK